MMATHLAELKYFGSCVNSQEVAQYYRLLAVAHRDSTQVMQDINAEYTIACDILNRQSRPGRTEEQYSSDSGVAESVRRVILRLSKLQGITIEVTGQWVWVDAPTREHNAVFHSLGMRWAGKKKRWYYAGVPAANHRRTYSMDEIRAKYGSLYVTRTLEEIGQD